MQRAEILNQRLHNQRLAGPPFECPEEMVRSLVGVQSQDYPGARWSVGQRAKCCSDADVERAYDCGAILRTHVLRPTWHFVTPDDIRWLLALTAPRVHALNGTYYRKFELDDALLARSHALFTDALHGGKHLTRTELANILARAGIVADKLRLSYIMMHAELAGLICSGAARGTQQTYALLAERAPQARELARDEALSELTRRFFTGHGPATLKDFVWWSGLSVAETKQGLEIAKREILHETVEGEVYWFADSAPAPAPAALTAYLLPEYDESFLPYRHINYADLPWTIPQETWNDFFYRPILVDGQRAGTWRRTVAKDNITLDVRLFTTLDNAQWQALNAAAERYATYMNLPVTIAEFQTTK
jgi:hypothetical protein